MFSVIIPTIWSPPINKIDELINKITECDKVTEIILINNNPSKYSYRYSDSKVKELRYNNIYVNQSWNVGVYQSKSDLICIMNDDIDFNVDIFNFVEDSLKNPNIGIIGVSKDCYNLENDQEFLVEKITTRNRGWGCLMFLRKDSYNWIPNDLKIHFGDDYLIKQLTDKVYRIRGLKIDSIISTSINSDVDFNKIIEQDNINSLKYNLPWSSDY
jgi:hypothetical protein